MLNNQPTPPMFGEQTLQSSSSSFTTFPHKNTYSKAALNVLKNQVPTNTDVLLFQTRCRRRAKKKKMREGLIAAEPIQKSQIVLEMNGFVAMSEEFPGKNGVPGCFKYDGVTVTTSDGGAAKVLFLVNANQNEKPDNDAMHTRRSCKPNCVIKHIISRHEPIGLLILATQHIHTDEEITVPFDVDWMESVVPLPCVKHEKDMRECGLEKRRREEFERKQRIADELAAKRANPRFFLAGEFRRVQEIFKRRKTEEEEEVEDSGAPMTSSSADVTPIQKGPTKTRQINHRPPPPYPSNPPPPYPSTPKSKKRPNHYSPTALTFLKSIPRLHKNMVLDPKSLKNAFKMYNHADNTDTLVTSETVDPSGILLEINGFISMADEVKRVPGDGTLIYGGMDKTQKLICIDTKTHNNDARVIRRSCFPNSTINHVTDDSELLRIVLVPTRVLRKGTEITLAFDFNSRHSEVPIECAFHKNSMHLCSFENERKRNLEKKEGKRRLEENSELEGAPKRKMENSESSQGGLQKAIDKPAFKIPPHRLTRRKSFPVASPTSSANSGILKVMRVEEVGEPPITLRLPPQKGYQFPSSVSAVTNSLKHKSTKFLIEAERPIADLKPGDVISTPSRISTSSVASGVLTSSPTILSEIPVPSVAMEISLSSSSTSEIPSFSGPFEIQNSDVPTSSSASEYRTSSATSRFEKPMRSDDFVGDYDNGDFETDDLGKTPPPPPPQFTPPHQSAYTDAADSDAASSILDDEEDDEEEPEESTWEMRCHCGMTHECGNTIECDLCKTWQHMGCMGLTQDSDITNYLCELCQDRKLPMNKTAAVKLQRKILKALGKSKQAEKTKNIQRIPQKSKGNSESVTDLLNSLTTTSDADPLLKEARLHRKAKMEDELLKTTVAVEVGDVILEVSGHFSKPEEVKRKTGGAAGVYMYHGLAKGDSGDSEGVICISTRRNSIAAGIRRSCAPNSALKHVVDAENSLKFVLIATEKVARGLEITLPFDADWRESKIPLKCSRHLKNLGECPLKKERRRVAAERRKSGANGTTTPEEAKTRKRRHLESGEGTSAKMLKIKTSPLPRVRSSPLLLSTPLRNPPAPPISNPWNQMSLLTRINTVFGSPNQSASSDSAHIDQSPRHESL